MLRFSRNSRSCRKKTGARWARSFRSSWRRLLLAGPHIDSRPRRRLPRRAGFLAILHQSAGECVPARQPLVALEFSPGSEAMYLPARKRAWCSSARDCARCDRSCRSRRSEPRGPNYSLCSAPRARTFLRCWLLTAFPARASGQGSEGASDGAKRRRRCQCSTAHAPKRLAQSDALEARYARPATRGQGEAHHPGGAISYRSGNALRRWHGKE